MNDAETMKHAKESEQLLESPAFKRAMESIESNLITKLKNSKWMQRRLREKIYDRLTITTALIDTLRYEIDSGKLAKDRLDKKKRLEAKK